MAGRTMVACACLCLNACGATVSIDGGSLETKPPPSSPPSSSDGVVVGDPFPHSPACGEASETPELSWEYRAGTIEAQETVAAVAVDAEGNVYLTGKGSTNVDFGAGPLVGHAGYVVSLTADGEYRWGRFLQGSDWGSAIAVTPAGGGVVAGSFRGQLELGGEVYDAGHRDMGFVVALTSMGEVLWSRVFGEGQINIATGLASGPDGGVIVVGSFQVAADFGGGMRQTTGGRDAFVAAYDADGSHRWDVTPPGPGTEIPIAVAVDSAGQVSVAGHFSSEWDLGGGTRHPDGSQAAFVLQLDHQGGYRWDWTEGFGGHGLGHAVAVDDSGQLYVTGEYYGSLSFAGTHHPQSSELSSYVVAFDADGTQRWGRTYAGSGGLRAFAVAVDESDRVLLAGHFAGEAIFDETPRASAGGYDIFALMLASSGEPLWDRTFGGSKDEEGHAMVRGCTGTLFVGGRDPGNDTGSLVSMDALLLAFD